MNASDSKSPTEPIAVVGMGCLFPRSPGTRSFWINIKSGTDAVGDVPATHWNVADYFDADPAAPDKTYARRGAFLEPIDFDPMEFGISPVNLEATDTTQLLGLVVAREALCDAGYALRKDDPRGRPFARERTSVILGVTGTLPLVIPLGARLGHPLWRRALREGGVPEAQIEDIVRRIADAYVPWQENSFPGLLGNVAAGRIAQRFDLMGTNCVVDAACASSLSALHLSILELQARRCDLAVTGGFDAFNDVFMYLCFSKTPALSPSGDCRPFSADADGTILGEGLGAVILKRLEDARRDGDRIRAVIRSVGTSSDGKGQAIYEPSAEGQARALQNAYRLAGVSPRSIELVEAHGTGTKVGDATEIRALAGTFRELGGRGTWCALGSIKSMIGHTKAAAGIAGLIKAVLALENKVLPPTLKVQKPLDVLKGDAQPLYINTRARPWVRGDEPRRAAVSAFGFGGSNFHCVLEEADARKSRADFSTPLEIAALGAESIEDLSSELARLKASPSQEELLAAVRRRRTDSDAHRPVRVALLLEPGLTAARAAIERLEKVLTTPPAAGFLNLAEGAYFGVGRCGGKLAFAFPGQGSQSTSMLRDLSVTFPQMLELLERGNRAFGRRTCGDRLSDLIHPVASFDETGAHAQEVRLRATESAQPALGAVCAGALRVIESFGVRADAAIGHSFGELVALHSAGCFDADALLDLAVLRGAAMAQGSAEPSGMLAVFLDKVALERWLSERALDLVIANHNAPRQVVLSGWMSNIERAHQLLSAEGITSRILPVSAGFHSPCVSSARETLRARLADLEWRTPRIPVVANVSADFYPRETPSARELLSEQIVRPVRFVEGVERLYDFGARTFLEVGPSNKLTSLVGAILEGRDHCALAIDASGGRQNGERDLAKVLAALFARGFHVDFNRWREGEEESFLPRPARGFTVALSGANVFRPRPQRPPIDPRPLDQSVPAIPSSPPSVSSSAAIPVTASAPEGDPGGDDAASGTRWSNAWAFTQQSLKALQNAQQQNAELFRLYLEGQSQALRTIEHLIAEQQRLAVSSLGVVPAASAPSESSSASRAVNGTRHSAARPSMSSVLPTGAATNGSAHAAPADATGGWERILLEVVAEKTGYPQESLALDQEIDQDLGIDSIKRVEILSALKERIPELPVFRPEQLASLRTLRHVLEPVNNGAAEPARPVLVASRKLDDGSPVHAETSHPATRGAAADDLANLLRSVVAEKTGYPVEMLELDLHLDTELGIDSIKRVEIFAALQARRPSLPLVQPKELGSFTTLQSVCDYFQGARDPVSTPPARAAAAKESATQGATACSQPRDLRLEGLETVELKVPAELAVEPGVLRWLVTQDGTSLPRAVAAELIRRGADAAVLPGEDAPIGRVNGCVLLAQAVGCEAVRGLRIVRRLADHLSRGPFVLASVSRMDGAFGLEHGPRGNAAQAAFHGLVKSAAHEWPACCAKIIDVDAELDADEAARAVADALLKKTPLEVGVAGQRWCTLRLKQHPVEVDPVASILRPGDLAVVSGGARGITAEVVLAMAQRLSLRWVLLGRSARCDESVRSFAECTDEESLRRALFSRDGRRTPAEVAAGARRILAAREIDRTLGRLAALRAPVEYHSVDVRDGALVESVIDAVVERHGPVRALFHGAGVILDRRIVDQTDSQWQEVIDTKVTGLQHLLQAIDRQGVDSLRCLALFSSTSARFGRRGQAAYAAANEVLNKIAQEEARRRSRVLSFNFGPWDGGMVGAAHRRLFETEGIGLLPLEAGARTVADVLLASSTPPVELVLWRGREVPANLPTVPRLERAFRRTIDVETLPILRSHVLHGKAVVPLAILVEWLAHAAIHGAPDLLFHGFDDLAVLKGLVLEPGSSLDVEAFASSPKPSGDHFIVDVELRCADRVHVRAQAILVRDLPRDRRVLEDSSSGALIAPGFYEDGRLFHGRDLHCIVTAEAVDENGIQGLARPAPAPEEWMQAPLRHSWLAEPSFLDAAFQLMILWCVERRAMRSLPSRMGRYRQFVRAFPREPARILIGVRRSTEHSAVAAIEIVSPKGELLARVDDYECVLDAALAKAFQRNRFTPDYA